MLGGKIDRIDRLDGTIRVIDYKTGNVTSIVLKNLEELFDKGIENHKKEILQALIYSFVLFEVTGESNIQPGIYSLNKLFEENFSPDIRLEKDNFSFYTLKDEFLSHLKSLISEIYSTKTVFEQTPHESHCGYCAFKTICQKN